ncbi:MAG: hypothetical protein ACI9LU_001000, partial [Polaribacter sp.]
HLNGGEQQYARATLGYIICKQFIEPEDTP